MLSNAPNIDLIEILPFWYKDLSFAIFSTVFLYTLSLRSHFLPFQRRVFVPTISPSLKLASPRTFLAIKSSLSFKITGVDLCALPIAVRIPYFPDCLAIVLPILAITFVLIEIDLPARDKNGIRGNGLKKWSIPNFDLHYKNPPY